MGSQTITVVAVGDPAVYAYVDRKLGIIDRYERSRNASVRFDIIPFESYYGTMMDALEGRREGDIVMAAGHLWLRDLVGKGHLAPVSWPSDPGWDEADIVPAIREEMRVDGVCYMYPSFCDGHFVLYRKSAVQEALGRPMPDVVTTDELREAAFRCHGVQGMHGIVLKAHPSEILLDVLPYFRQEGVELFDPRTHRPDFNREAGVRALEKYLALRDIAPKETGTFGNDEVREAFQQKRAAFAVTWGGQLGVVLDDRCLEPEDVGFCVLRTAWNVTWGFAVNARSARKELANDLLGHLASREVDRLVGAWCGSPVRRSTYEADGGKYRWYAAHLDLIERYAKPLPQMKDAGARLDALYRALAAAFRDECSPGEALARAERDILDLMAG
jgi:multiple sugar transport system substrate-binding protein